MERELGKDLEQGKKRVAFLMDNCDAVEEKGYMKPFTPEELARMKESLSETDIEINDIEEEKTAASATTTRTATLSRAGRRTAKNYKQHFSKSEEKQVLTTKKQSNDEARFNYSRWQ